VSTNSFSLWDVLKMSCEKCWDHLAATERYFLDFYTIAEVAYHLGTSERNLRHWHEKGLAARDRLWRKEINSRLQPRSGRASDHIDAFPEAIPGPHEAASIGCTIADVSIRYAAHRLQRRDCQGFKRGVRL
jgi:hypothetical protein